MSKKPTKATKGHRQDDESDNSSVSQKELEKVQKIFELLCQNYQKCDKINFVYIQKLEKLSAKHGQSLQELGINEELYNNMVEEINSNAINLYSNLQAGEKFSCSAKEKKFLKEAEILSLVPTTFKKKVSIPISTWLPKPAPLKPREEYVPKTGFGCFLHYLI